MKLYRRVLDENNQPVAGAVVTVLWQGCSRAPRMVSDELGMFYFEGPSDRAYRLEASAGGRYGVSESKGRLSRRRHHHSIEGGVIGSTSCTSRYSFLETRRPNRPLAGQELK